MRSLRPLAVLAALPLIHACSTELEVNAPYQDVTVVYGLLSVNDLGGENPAERHYVKINKAFLGDGDALLYALIPDSNEYTEAQLPEADRKVIDLNNGQEYTLRDTLIENRVTGTFFHPLQRLYYFDASLDPTHRYKVSVKAKGKTVEAVTPVVTNNTFLSGFLLPGTTSRINLKIGQVYNTVEVRFRSGAQARRYDVYYRFNYIEERDGVQTPKSITAFLGTVRTNGLIGNEQLQVGMNGEGFFQTIANNISPDPLVTKRIHTGVDFLFHAASDEFSNYLQLSEPVSSLVEERPEYTNITNGYGLFASRSFRTAPDCQLNDDARLELVTGPYTGALLFCIQNAGGPPLSCN